MISLEAGLKKKNIKPKEEGKIDLTAFFREQALVTSTSLFLEEDENFNKSNEIAVITYYIDWFENTIIIVQKKFTAIYYFS